MATLLDHKRHTKTHGTPDNLIPGMVTEMMFTPHAKRLTGNGRIRYAEQSVRAAIRAGRQTDSGQELIMSDAERDAWERSNPLPGL